MNPALPLVKVSWVSLIEVGEGMLAEVEAELLEWKMRQ